MRKRGKTMWKKMESTEFMTVRMKGKIIWKEM